MPRMPDLSKPKVPTMIELDTSLWLKLKKDCLNRGVTMKDLISDMLLESYGAKPNKEKNLFPTTVGNVPDCKSETDQTFPKSFEVASHEEKTDN